MQSDRNNVMFINLTYVLCWINVNLYKAKKNISMLSIVFLILDSLTSLFSHVGVVARHPHDIGFNGGSLV